MSNDFNDKVAIVTGAGNGLGRSHALALAAKGAKVVINDFGGKQDGSGGSSSAMESVVREIIENGGEAIGHTANVVDADSVNDMTNAALNKWGRVDILVNNAGILRDKTFGRMSIDDFRAVFDVHVMGAVNCTKAVWPIMQEQKYGRVVMTTSGSGLFGNYGQSNYSAAKLALVGLMNTLGLEGAKYNIKVNALAPAAGTRMTVELIPQDIFKLMTPESVSIGLVTLCSENAPSRKILCGGGGVFSSVSILESEAVFIAKDKQTPETVNDMYDNIFSHNNLASVESANEQSMNFAKTTLTHLGIKLPDLQGKA